MEKIVKENYEFKRSEMTAEDAKKMFAEIGEDYKIEIIDDLGVDKVSIYQQGEFIDLCRGTHIPSTGYLKAFKLMSTAGAYVIISKFLLAYKCFKNFFNQLHHVLHFILYFCALEILPDLILWKGVVFVDSYWF